MYNRTCLCHTYGGILHIHTMWDFIRRRALISFVTLRVILMFAPESIAAAPVLAHAPVVMLDAGHGGTNIGAQSIVAERGRVYEKDVTLEIARQVQEQLEREGVTVVLTRQSDEYLTIRERVRRANHALPACFVSIHTNASVEHSGRGVETYVLTDVAADRDAKRMSWRALTPVAALLDELKRLDVAHLAASLAGKVQGRLARGSESRGVRQAEYDVLAGVDVPAILVEVGFLDQPRDSVTTPEGQKRIADALANGIIDYLGVRRLAYLHTVAK
jgi:N-acetylmuramoyl-L-alanine amidase